MVATKITLRRAAARNGTTKQIMASWQSLAKSEM